MSKRILSLIVILVLTFLLAVYSKNIFSIANYIVAMLCLKDFLDAKDSSKSTPTFIICIASLMLTLLIFIGVDYKVMAGLFIAMLFPLTIYHTDDYDITDAFYMIGVILLLGLAFNLIIVIRSLKIEAFIYLVLIATITDTYAYMTGMLIGKKKLLEDVSPNKTIEGLLGGIFFGTLFASIYFRFYVLPDMNICYIILLTLFLSIMGEIGDLVFSAMKRHYHLKDFSNLIPTYGGMLDLSDSLIFIVLGFSFFLTLI